MATTTNYGWTTPDDTALVKDGASAIRTLGSSIDTTTKALNPSTTLGDIEYRSSTANTNTRLPLGTAGQVLAVNSGATAPEWKTISSGGMTELATGSLSGVTTTVSGLSGAYKDLIVYVYAFTDGAGNSFNVRLNTDTTTTYRHAKMNTGSTAITAPSAATYLSIGDFVSTGNYGLMKITIPFYSTTSAYKHIFATQNTSNQAVSVVGYYQSTSAITSISFGSNGFTTSVTGGTYVVYGVN